MLNRHRISESMSDRRSENVMVGIPQSEAMFVARFCLFDFICNFCVLPLRFHPLRLTSPSGSLLPTLVTHIPLAAPTTSPRASSIDAHLQF